MKSLTANTAQFACFAALMLSIVSGCGPKADAPFKDTIMGGRGQVGDLLVSGGNLMVYEEKPGVFFGTVKTPGSTEHFSYLIVFKHGKPQTAFVN